MEKKHNLIGPGITFLLAFLIVLVPFQPGSGQAQTGQISLFDKNDAPLLQLTDGDLLRLQITLSQAVAQNTPVDFKLKGLELTLASCTIKAQDDTCNTDLFSSLGWYWDPGGEPQPERLIQAIAGGEVVAESAIVLVNSRPVVMVHGFSSNWEAWVNYLGADGYLAKMGLHGYAVGDGQVPGVMNTGDFAAPTQRTNTIAENAAILGEYIQNVQQASGAEKVDLVVHSMGGMISRYYIDRLMKNGEVAQLIILGTPMAGTACANLPASLGFYLPATIEIQPSYMMGVFNQQITHRHGVPFHAIAGTQILDAIQSPCTGVPSDIVVSLESMNAIPLEIVQIPLLHVVLNTSPEVFETFVKPLLQTPPGAFPLSVDSTPTTTTGQPLQFTGTYSGNLKPGETQTVTIAIDPNVTVASFGLYDTTRSLSVSVQGASGKTIVLSPEANGLITIDDPQTLVYLGYGFKNPKPGAWIVTLGTTVRTPTEGAAYAITARFEGGAVLDALTSPILPRQGERVNIQASLRSESSPVQIISAQAKIYAPDGQISEMALDVKDNQGKAVFTPSQTGVYGAEVHITGLASDGMTVDRSTWLAFEAQPSNLQTLLAQSLFAIAVISVVILLLSLFRRRKAKKSKLIPHHPAQS